MGDFNCSQTYTVFNPLKNNGYESLLTNQKTILRKKCLKQDFLASEYDNMFYYSNKVTDEKAGIENFYSQFATPEEDRKISDDIPLFEIVKIN